MSSNECSCHLNPPCSFCTSLNEEEANVFANGGAKALEKYRNRTVAPTVKWLIEEGTFSEDIQPIVDEIRQQGMIAETIRYKPFESGEYNQFSPDDCVIVLGSINLVRQIQRQKPWLPGSFANFQNFDCLTYYAYFGKYLLNENYYIMPLGEVKRKHDHLQRKHGKLFIRPCSGTKNFSGQILDFGSLLNHEDQYGKPELPVVISSAKEIRQEYRMFCSGEKYIAGSMYYNDQGIHHTEALKTTIEDLSSGKFGNDDHNAINAISYAENILKKVKWRPDKIFGMDIALDASGHPHLLEINSFSCSGWYKTPPKMLVAEAARLAREEWEEINNI